MPSPNLPRRSLQARFSTIIILTLILPVIALTIFLDGRMNDVYRSRVNETLRSSKSGFLSRINLESQDISQRAADVMQDDALISLLISDDLRSKAFAGSLSLLGRQVDFAFTWLSRDLKRELTIGPSILDLPAIKAMARELSSVAPGYRIMVDHDGLFIVHVSVKRTGNGISGYLVIQRRINRGDIEAMRLSLGQELAVIEGSNGRILFSSLTESKGQTNSLGKVHPLWQKARMDQIIDDTSSGRPAFSLMFDLPQFGVSPLVGVISIPDQRILAADTARAFVSIAVAVIVLIILSGFLLTRSVISPIVSLAYAVESMRRHLSQHGPLVSIPIKRNDEVGDLAKAVNQLGLELRNSAEKIEEQRAEIGAYTHSLEERVQERTIELEEARQRAEIANQHKSKFLVNMNHELRTPLNSIAGITDLLRLGAYEKHDEMATDFAKIWAAMVGVDGVPTDCLVLLENLGAGLVTESSSVRLIVRYLSERLRESGIIPYPAVAAHLEHILALADEEELQVFRAYNNIRDAGESLLGIIDEVINLSRIESGVITISPQRVDIADLLAKCMSHAESYARSKRKQLNLTFSRQIEDSVPAFVMLDGQKIKQVLLNLLTNAVKYTDHGYVHCRIGVVASDGRSFLHCSVQDSGRGIAEKDRDMLFLEFGRAFEVREIEGSGLGLALSRKLIERHGGAMGYSSHESDGSTFWFTIPLVLPGLA